MQTLRRCLLRYSLALGVALATCTANAASESLRILSWPGYASPEQIKAFENQHHVNVELTVVNSDDELWDLARKDGGRAFDLMAVNTAELQRYIDAELVAPIRTQNIPNLANQLSRFATRKNIPGVMRGGATYAIPYTYSAMGLIYNRKLVSQPPSSMTALWDLRYKGKVLIFNGSAHNFSLTALTLGIHTPFALSNTQFNKVVERLTALRSNVAGTYSSPEEAVTLFNDKQIALIYANYGDQQIRALRKAGADIGYIIPREGALAWLDCWAIFKRTTNPALAEAWINHMLTPAAGRQLTEAQGLSSTLKETNQPSMRDTDKLIWLEPVEDAHKRAVFWERILSAMPRPRP